MRLSSYNKKVLPAQDGTVCDWVALLDKNRYVGDNKGNPTLKED
jgi:hypothetical protein